VHPQVWLNDTGLRPGVVVHTCNASYLGGGDRDGHDLDQPGQQVSMTPSEPIAGRGGTRPSSQLLGRHK
jgi:hypothetical protein